MFVERKYLEKIGSMVFAYLGIFFLLLSAFWMLKDNLQIYWWDEKKIIMICGIVSSLMLIFYWNQWTLRIGCVLFLILGIFLIFHRNELLEQEILEYGNHILILMNEYHYTDFPVIKEPISGSGTTLLWILALCFGPSFGAAVILGRKFFVGLFPLFPIFISGFFLGYSPQFSSIFFLLAGVTIRYLCFDQQHERGAKKAYLFGFLVCLLSIGITGICYKPVADNLLSYTEKVTENHQKLGNQILSKMKEKSVSEMIPKILKIRENKAVLDYKPPNLTDEPVLSLTLEELPNHPVYIKDFVGVTYDHGVWYPAEEQKFTSFLEEVGESEDTIGTEIQTIFYENHKEIFPVETAKIHLYKTNGNLSPSLYFTNLPNQAQIFGDSGIRMKEKEYDFQRLLLEEEMITGGVFGIYLLTQEETYFSSYYGETSFSPQKITTEEVEKIYTPYMEETYLQVPYEQLPQLTENLNEAMFTLFTECNYSFDMKPPKEGEDLVESFLFQQKKGYCMHFASAYTLLLRLQGKPARYVGGYLVLPSDFKQNSDGTYTAEITEERAHAWTESYYENAGWVYFDATPADYRESLAQTKDGMSVEEIVRQREELQEDLTGEEELQEQEESTEQEDFTKEEELQEQEKSEESFQNFPNKEEQDETLSQEQKQIFSMVIFLVFAFSLIFGTWFGWKKYLVWKKETIFLGEDKRKAIEFLIQEIFALLEKQEFIMEEEESELQFAERVEGSLSCFEKGELVETVKIAISARYGNGEVTEEQREKVLQVYGKLRMNDK